MEPQKALHLYIEEEKKKPKYIDKEYAMFEKLDGWYGYKDFGEPIKSRAMRAIPSVTHLSEILDDRMKHKGRLIFEILIHGEKEFSILNGILNRTVGDFIARNAYLMVHDFIPLDEPMLPFVHRYDNAKYLVDMIDHDNIRMCKYLDSSRDIVDWKNFAQFVWDKGGEGVVLKNLYAPYSPGKRNADLLKIKEEITLDLLVVGMEEGLGKYKGTLGALVCRDKKRFKHIVSGMTDANRHEWWENNGAIIGRVVEVKAMKRLPDGQLREPRFKAVRYDKTEAQID